MTFAEFIEHPATIAVATIAAGALLTAIGAFYRLAWKVSKTVIILEQVDSRLALIVESHESRISRLEGHALDRNREARRPEP